MNNKVKHPLAAARCDAPMDIGAIGSPVVKRLPMIVIDYYEASFIGSDSPLVPMLVREFYTDDGIILGRCECRDSDLRKEDNKEIAMEIEKEKESNT